jgi:hypothetical protein
MSDKPDLTVEELDAFCEQLRYCSHVSTTLVQTVRAAALKGIEAEARRLQTRHYEHGARVVGMTLRYESGEEDHYEADSFGKIIIPSLESCPTPHGAEPHTESDRSEADFQDDPLEGMSRAELDQLSKHAGRPTEPSGEIERIANKFYGRSTAYPNLEAGEINTLLCAAQNATEAEPSGERDRRLSDLRSGPGLSHHSIEEMERLFPEPSPSGSVEGLGFPSGAIVNGTTLLDRIEFNYKFESEAGPLTRCVDWHHLRECFEHLARETPRYAEALKRVEQKRDQWRAAVEEITTSWVARWIVREREIKAERDRISQENERLEKNAAEADGCFEAALVEGWLDALAEGDTERIRDLWNRRISFAHTALQGRG